MSVLIKDMTLDEFSDYGEYCQTLIGTGQAVELPQHGRLIDADALKTMWDDVISRMLEKGIEYLDYHVDTLFSDFKHDVDKMPTIIPADLPVMYYPQIPGITPTVIPDKEGE